MDEVQKIIFDIQNREKLQALNHDLELERNLVVGLNQQLQHGTINQGQFAAAALAPAQNIRALNKDIAELEKSTKGLMSPHGLLNLSYVFDDLSNTTGGWERKLSSISNNIPGVLASLGVGGGLVGVLALVGTGLITVARNWDTLMDSFKSIAIGEAADQLKALEDRAEKAAEKFDKLTKRPSKTEAAGAKSLQELFDETGAVNIEKGLAGVLGTSGLGEDLTEEERSDLAYLSSKEALDKATEHLYGQGLTGEQLDQARDAYGKALIAERAKREAEYRGRHMGSNVAKAKEIITGALEPGQAGAGSRATLADLVDKGQGSFPPGFLGDVLNSFPEQIARQQGLEREGAANAARSDAATRAKRERQRVTDDADHKWERAERELSQDRERHAKFVEQLSRDGQENEEHMKREQEREAQRQERENAHFLQQTHQRLQREDKERPQQEAAQRIRNISRFQGARPTEDQVMAAAQDAVALAKQGLDVNSAAMSAFLSMRQASERLRQQLEQQAAQWRAEQNRLGMSPDQTGNFSQLTPFSMGPG
jgi:hypothetical protein